MGGTAPDARCEAISRSLRIDAPSNRHLRTRRNNSVLTSSPSAAAACPLPFVASNFDRSLCSTTCHRNRDSNSLPPALYVNVTQSSSGGIDAPSHRGVTASSPRARRASGLLPASRAALRITARSIGAPFQCVISAPETSSLFGFTGETHETRYFRSLFS